MNWRSILTLLAGFTVAACGPRSPESSPRKVNGPAVASSLNVVVKEQIGFSFHITNNSPKKMEFTFPSGQTHEIVVLDKSGKEVWRWSEGQMFTQMLQSKVLEPEESITYEATWSAPRGAGTYTAVARLASDNHPVEQRVEFSIP